MPIVELVKKTGIVAKPTTAAMAPRVSIMLSRSRAGRQVAVVFRRIVKECPVLRSEGSSRSTTIVQTLCDTVDVIYLYCAEYPAYC